MNAMRCRYGNEMIRALQTGALSASLVEHQKSCGACRDAMLVGQALRHDASDLAARHIPPPSAHVWAAAERHYQMAALVRATRFLNVLKVAGVVYTVVLIFWGLRVLAAHSGTIMEGLDPKSLNATIEGAVLAVVFIGSGLWYTLRRDDRRIG